MHYANSVQEVLLRKIQKAENHLLQLKLDYCRFIFGLTHRSQVMVDGTCYQVRSVDVDTMVRQDDGTFSKPVISGLPVDSGKVSEVMELGTEWELTNPVRLSPADS